MRPALIAITTFLAVVLAVVVFFAFRISRGASHEAVSAHAAQPQLTLLSVSHSFKGGMYSVSGSVLAPTACTPVTASSSLSADGVRVDITSRVDSGVCLDLPATTTFKTSVAGAAGSAVRIYVNGELSSTTP